MPEILERALNPRVPPCRVFLSHAYHELPHLRQDTATTRSAAPVRPLLRDQLAVPSEESVGCHYRRHLAQGRAPQPVPLYGESPPVVIRELQTASPDLPAEQAILFDQIGERLSFAAIEPAGDSNEQQPKDRDVDHEPEVISRTAFATTDGPRSHSGTIRGQVFERLRHSDYVRSESSRTRVAAISGSDALGPEFSAMLSILSWDITGVRNRAAMMSASLAEEAPSCRCRQPGSWATLIFPNSADRLGLAFHRGERRCEYLARPTQTQPQPLGARPSGASTES